MKEPIRVLQRAEGTWAGSATGYPTGTRWSRSACPRRGPGVVNTLPRRRGVEPGAPGVHKAGPEGWAEGVGIESTDRGRYLSIIVEFIRTIVEQLEDAAQLLGRAEVRQVRVGFILIDNVAELWLLQRASALAAAEAAGFDPESRRRVHAAVEAVERRFDEKIRVVRGGHPGLDRHLNLLAVCHRTRNELYHWGLVKAEVLQPLARAFYPSPPTSPDPPPLMLWDPPRQAESPVSFVGVTALSGHGATRWRCWSDRATDRWSWCSGGAGDAAGPGSVAWLAPLGP